TKMSIEQRANIKFCFKLDKTFTETFQLMQQVYGDDCLSRGRVHEWTRFKNGREDINDDPHVGQAKFVITPESIEKVRDFLNIHPKSSLRFMEIELGMSKDSIHRILTEKLGYRKVCSHFVPHKLTGAISTIPRIRLIWHPVTFIYSENFICR
ncbi:GVQW3 protein, partial [Acromyrmex charruanus]